MKRFASLVTATALAGALISLQSTSFAAGNTYNMYLQPISPLNAIYAPGDTIRFAALTDVLTGSNPIVLTLGATVGYSKQIFDMSALGATPDPSPDPVKPSQLLWNLNPPVSFSKTRDGLPTFQLGVGHTRQTFLGPYVTIPTGTYTIGTFSFPILANAMTGPADLILPSAFGKIGPNAAIDFINGIDSQGTNRMVLAYPDDGINKFSKLTYNIGPAAVPEPGALAFLVFGGLTGAAFLHRRRG